MVLLDTRIDRLLAHEIAGHWMRTAPEQRWTWIANGGLQALVSQCASGNISPGA